MDELQNQLLAVLFAAEAPLTLGDLTSVFSDTPREDLAVALDQMASNFNAFQSAVEVRKIGGGYSITTQPRHHEVIRAYLKTKPTAKLSLAALETLAVVAYRQPITLPEIAEVRGVKGTSTLKTLLEKKLIVTRGRRKTIGRPILYGTSRDFLVHFGLDDLSELPSLEELEEVLAQE